MISSVLSKPTTMAVLAVLLEVVVLQCKLLWCGLIWLVHLIRPLPRKSVSGRVVLITGAGKGIGRQLAHKFAELGAKLALVDIDQTAIVNTARELEGRCLQVEAYCRDITKRNLVLQLAGEIQRDFGDVDILVNNAGVLLGKSISDLTEGDIHRTIEVNLMSQFWTIQAFLPAMKRRNSGHIVNVASFAGKIACSLATDYCASKYGVLGLTESLRLELRSGGITNIHTTVVCPSFVKTDMTKNINDGKTKFVPRFGTMLEAKDVADAIVTGVQEGQTLVYIPKRLGAVAVFTGLLTTPMLDLYRDFIRTDLTNEDHQ